MEVIDLEPEHEDLYFLCLEDWSDEAREAGDHKKHWYQRMKDKGLRVKLALDQRGQVSGLIQYLPIEQSCAEGKDLYFILCIWVHGHKQGRGDCRGRGLGKALLQAAETDARSLGAKGIAAWGLALPFWMKASWFRRRGFQKCDRIGIQVLLWKPFSADALPPAWIRPQKKPGKTPGQVTVTAFKNGWCMSQNLVFERARRAALATGEKVEFREIDTSERAVFREWGILDALYIDDRRVRTGPPPSYEKIRRLIARQAAKLL